MRFTALRTHVCVLCFFAVASASAEDVVKVPMHAVSFEELKDWQIKTPTELKFDGSLPLNDSSGKPITARVAPEGVYVNLGMNGTKLMPAGGIWNVTATYSDNTTDSYRYKLDKKGDGYTVVSVQARLGTFQGKPIALIDVNSDGRFDGEGDQMVLDKTTVLNPGDPVKIGNDEWSVKISPSGNSITFSKGGDFGALLASGDGSAEGALTVLNGVRAVLKLQPLKRDPELERIGALHIKYMAKHGITHVEDKAAPEYSADGAKAGMGCVISGNPGDARSGVINLLDTFFHRISMLESDLAVTGINNGDGFTTVNVHDGPKKKVTMKEPFCYPPPDATNVRTGWNGREGPSPIPETPSGGVGETVTITFPNGQKVKNGALTLHEGSLSGAAVDAWVSTPEKPADKMFGDNMNTICLIAKTPLKPGTIYVAEATADIDGKPFKKEWTFTTSKSRSGPQMHRQK